MPIVLYPTLERSEFGLMYDLTEGAPRAAIEYNRSVLCESRQRAADARLPSCHPGRGAESRAMC